MFVLTRLSARLNHLHSLTDIRAVPVTGAALYFADHGQVNGCHFHSADSRSYKGSPDKSRGDYKPAHAICSPMGLG